MEPTRLQGKSSGRLKLGRQGWPPGLGKIAAEIQNISRNFSFDLQRSGNIKMPPGFQRRQLWLEQQDKSSREEGKRR